jgi:PPK2 family polyphosphate:nucleotide phosphotransferase
MFVLGGVRLVTERFAAQRTARHVKSASVANQPLQPHAVVAAPAPAGRAQEASSMDYRKKFRVEPGARLRLASIDPSYTGKHVSHEDAMPQIQKHVARMDALQYLLYADAKQSLLVVLQALDAAGKDGVIRHLSSGMNPQGTSVFGFEQPAPVQAAHDFLWRAHRRAPGRGEVVIFNRSHYEDVLVVRVHKLAPRSVWSKRYELINDFERMLVQNGTTVLKFFLHISPEEQLARLKERLEDPARNWKISESDYSERELWPDYTAAYEEALSETSTERAPWYVIPSNHKWFRNLAASRIIADSMEDRKLELPPTRVDLTEIRRKYHVAEVRQSKASVSRRRKGAR